MQTALDELAIKNSLFNLFKTMKGQKLFNPNYGLSLYQHIFEPISEMRGKMIGDDILRGIETYEPRVEVIRITVQPIIDDHEYRITLIIRIPVLSKQEISLNGLLTKEGFDI
jgi:phage baseplate assembly protein W